MIDTKSVPVIVVELDGTAKLVIGGTSTNLAVMVKSVDGASFGTMTPENTIAAIIALTSNLKVVGTENSITN